MARGRCQLMTRRGDCGAFRASLTSSHETAHRECFTRRETGEKNVSTDEFR